MTRSTVQSDVQEQRTALLALFDRELVHAAVAVQTAEANEADAVERRRAHRERNASHAHALVTAFVACFLVALGPAAIACDRFVGADGWGAALRALSPEPLEILFWVGPIALLAVEFSCGLLAAEAAARATEARSRSRWSSLALLAGFACACVVPTLAIAARLAARAEEVLLGVDPVPGDLLTAGLSTLSFTAHSAVLITGVFIERPLGLVFFHWHDARLALLIRSHGAAKRAALATFCDAFATRTAITPAHLRPLPVPVTALAARLFPDDEPSERQVN